MKKAFALALAVLMVCTMAFAVSTGNQTGYPGGTSAADNTYMQSIVPGQSIVFTQEELGLTDQNWGKTNGSFDPKKNTVALTVPVGSDLIASQGWVRTDETTYKYVVTTKANETSVLDNNADIIISGVKVTVYGVSAPALNVSYVKDVNGVTNYTYVTSFDELASFSAKEPGDNFCPMNAKSEDHILAMCFDYGRKADEADAVFGAGGLNVANMDKTGKILYTVKAATVDGQYITSGSWNQSVTEDNGGKVTVSVPLKAGDKIYFVQCNKAVVASTIGTKSFEDGFHLVIAHTDSPRLDLRPTPLYESDHLSYFKTHYYGGIRKYQWGTIPLSIHGVFTREDGSTVTVRVGEDENDPVFCITDLLPHLGAEQNARPLKDGIKAEELNILIGSDAVDDENVKEAVKLNTMILLNEKYGITEKEFMRAEIEITPAYKSRDVGFDRSMVGGYGHDDRVDAYPALMAEIETKNPAYTTVCVLTDKEEIGSDGVTGMQSMYAFHFMQELCRAAGQDDILAFRHSVCLSADVTAAYDPTWASAFEPMNGTYAGRGVAIFKYTGGGSKGSASDACAELVSDITRMLDNGNVAWQIGELGRLDLGGGGTIAKYVANRGIPVLDIGVPVLSMHAPFEVIHKNDLYMAYRAFSLFNNAQ